MEPHKFRPLKFGVTRVTKREGQKGISYVMAEQPLRDFPERLTDRFEHWKDIHPEQAMFSQRRRKPDASLGDWETITYKEAWTLASGIAQGLLNLGLSEERPVVIVSENSLEHAMFALGSMLAGVPYASISPPYSLVSQDFEKLKHVFKTLTPGLVFAQDSRYAKALLTVAEDDIAVVMARGELEGRRVTDYAEFAATTVTNQVKEAISNTGPETILKFLFTSGSTSMPKAVINTHRMCCANQQQMTQSMPVLLEKPLVLVDWLPWNHTFGGNHNFGMILYNGGTLYIDDGKPTPALIGETLRNLKEIAPTVYFNVPTGYEAIANAMKSDVALRKNFLSRVKMFFYAGAALAQPIWDSLYASEESEIGERIVMTSGLGMTESGPFGLFVTNPNVRAGDLGVPTPGMEIKLVDVEDKTEVRYRGPNVTRGYWRAPKETEDAFDEEGFFKTGDAVKWIDPKDPHLGLRFDGRIAEDFKLATGTFVSVGPLRGRIIAEGAPYVQDAVITGLNLKEVGAMIFPTPKIRELTSMTADVPLAEVLTSAPVQDFFQGVIDSLAATSSGSATRVARLCLLIDPPSLDRGEVTDKGSINQRAVLSHRAELVSAFHEDRLNFTIKPNN
jgi:feruloyl-CoA synthase